MRAIAEWRRRAAQLKMETYAMTLAYRDPRTPWVARLFAACVVAYAFSPIDLVPDFIPVLGYLDDLLLVPLGIALAVKMIPPDVLADCRIQAERAMSEGARRTNWVAAAAIVTLWFILAAVAVILVARLVRARAG
jgi:uncharacterized membrane protein YkvA (DUF1232 family)